jgi:hypothetical protein
MIRSLLRSVASIAVSLVVAMALIIAVEVVSAVLHPFPPGVDPADYEVCKAHVAKYPHWILAMAVVAWGGTTFVSVWLATRMGAGRHPAHGIGVGSLLFLAAAFNMFMLPYPVWFKIVSLLVLPLAIFAAVKLGRAPQSRPPDVGPVPGNPAENDRTRPGA